DPAPLAADLAAEGVRHGLVRVEPDRPRAEGRRLVESPRAGLLLGLPAELPHVVPPPRGVVRLSDQEVIAAMVNLLEPGLIDPPTVWPPGEAVAGLERGVVMPPLPPDGVPVREADRREVRRPGVELDRGPAEAAAVAERARILDDPQAGRQ